MYCCKIVCKLPYTRLRRSSSIAATSSTVACFSSWIVTIRPPEHTVFQEPTQEKIWYSKVGWPSRPSGVAETTNTGNTLLFVPALHCDWPHEMASSPLPLLFPPTTTSYRAGAIFKFEMCQLAPRHPVYVVYHQCYDPRRPRYSNCARRRPHQKYQAPYKTRYSLETPTPPHSTR